LEKRKISSPAEIVWILYPVSAVLLISGSVTATSDVQQQSSKK
jgi:hypothetical protein